MLEALKQQVYEANMLLPAYHLVTFTWGNVSGIDREKGLFVIKPSGVPYEELKPEDMVVMDLEGNKVEGYAHPRGALPPFSPDRRRGSHPFPLGHHLGPGRPGYSRLRNHPRGLYLRARPLLPGSDPSGSEFRL